jgi:hypothetical protein
MKDFVDLARSFWRDSKKKRLVYFVPCEKAELDGSWFRYPKGAVADYYNLPMMRYCLEQSGFRFKVTEASEYELEADRVEKVIVFNMPYYNNGKFLSAIPTEKKVLFIWEPPSTVAQLYDKDYHRQFSRVFTWQDDLVDNKKYFKFYYQLLLRLEETFVPFRERRFCTMLNRNKGSNHRDQLYSERIDAINFFESLGSDQFVLYGDGWEPAEHPSFAGPVPDKIEVMKNFRFCLCYENMTNIEGYLSEKILDCFCAGCLPIYWGASNIDKYVPADCYIDRRQFSSNEEMYKFLKSIGEEEFEQYQLRFRAFMNSASAKLFSARNFVEIVMRDVMNRQIDGELLELIGPNEARA